MLHRRTTAYSVASALLVTIVACTSGTGAGAGSNCPASPPVDGAACTGSTSVTACEYRLSSSCTVLAACGEASPTTGFRWSVIQWPGCAPNPSACPASFADVVVGSLCSMSATDVCAYPEGDCACEPCFGDAGSGQVWRCNAWTSVAAGCPVPRPLLGSACTNAGAACNYDLCCSPPALGPPMQCDNGVWTERPTGGCKCAPATCP